MNAKTSTLMQELDSAVPGDIFITTVGTELTYIEKRDSDYHFPHLMQAINELATYYVTYTQEGICCFNPGYLCDSSQLSHKLVKPTTPMKTNSPELQLNKFYLRHDGKIIEILEEISPIQVRTNDKSEYISELIFFGSDQYYYSKDGKAYTDEGAKTYETFLVAQIEFTPLSCAPEEIESAQDKLLG